MANKINENPDAIAGNDTHPEIKCASVYKIYGENAGSMVRSSNGNIDVKAFQEAGCIFGVNSASFDVSKGGILVVMGLSGSENQHYSLYLAAD